MGRVPLCLLRSHVVVVVAINNLAFTVVGIGVSPLSPRSLANANAEGFAGRRRGIQTDHLVIASTTAPEPSRKNYRLTASSRYWDHRTFTLRTSSVTTATG